jgi:diguanylate cyclase (GGDEF)-like protein/PAS domain S-box-containing protein
MRLSYYRQSLPAIAVVGALLCFVTLLGWTEYANWLAQVARVETSLQQTAEAVAQHADDVVEMSRLPLASLISEINDEVGHEAMPAKIRSLILRQMRASPTLYMLTYIDASGRLVATSSTDRAVDIGYGDRDYFKFHKSSPFNLPVVGKPIRSRLNGAWIIPITQKVTLADGSFGGVVVSAIRINHFVNFFRNFSMGSEGAFLLVRGDGIVLARGPVAESVLGKDISSNELFVRRLKERTAGAYHFNSPLDGSDRAGGYYQSERTGLVVLVSASETDVFQSWVENARVRWIYALVLLSVVGAACLLWLRQTRLRLAGQALLAAREAEFRLLAESSSDVISRFDENGIRQYVSPAAIKVFGLEPSEMLGKSIYCWMDGPTETAAREAVARLRNGSIHEKVIGRHVRPDGEAAWLEMALSRVPPAPDHPGSSIVAVTRDVTRHKEMQDELGSLANTDELTGLANRRFFNLRSSQLLENARRTATPLALFMIDADHFKLFNDTYGHAAGDGCLREIAAAIASNIGPEDVAARYGGEEIAVVLPGADYEQAASVAETIRSAVEALEIHHERNLPFERVTVSIGIASLDSLQSPFMTWQELFALSDEALYRAKSAGRNRYSAAGWPKKVLKLG